MDRPELWEYAISHDRWRLTPRTSAADQVGLLRERGAGRALEVDEPRLSVGPYPQAFWNDLATHNPYRIRIVAPGSELRSPWVELEIEPSE